MELIKTKTPEPAGTGRANKTESLEAGEENIAMEGCNFKIGDLVAKKRDVELWAAGENGSTCASKVSIIVERENGFTVTNGRHSGMKTSEVILESEAKAHALKFLADRMVIIAGA